MSNVATITMTPAPYCPSPIQEPPFRRFPQVNYFPLIVYYRGNPPPVVVPKTQPQITKCYHHSF